MIKKTFLATILLALIGLMLTTPMALASNDYWEVSEGDVYRWTFSDEYYDITDEDKDIDADSQSETIEAITYNIEYWNASQGAAGWTPWSGQSLYINITSNAYAIQIWGYQDDVRLYPHTDYDMRLIKQQMSGDYSTTSLDKPTYDPNDFPYEFFPVANYTIVFLSRYEFEYLEEWSLHAGYTEEVDTDHYHDKLGDGKMFKVGTLVDLSVFITNNSYNEVLVESGSIDTETYDIEYDRYAHTSENLGIQIDTDSSLATTMRLGIIYSDLLTLDKIVFLTDIDFSSGVAAFNMKSALKDMSDSITVSPDRVYQGDAARIVTVFVLVYSDDAQNFADEIDQTVGSYGDSGYIAPETDETLLGFYKYQARFLEGEYDTKLDTEYSVAHLDLTIKEIDDTKMDTDDEDDIEYSIEMALESDAPVEVHIPSYLDLGLIAPMIPVLELIGEGMPYEMNPHGIYIPSAINHIYSSPADHIEDLMDEVLEMYDNETYTPEFDYFLIGELISTVSFVNLMIVPNDFDFDKLKDVVDGSVDYILDLILEIDYEDFDQEVYSDLDKYFDVEVEDDTEFTIEVEKNIMPYFYDTHAGPTQLGLKGVLSEGFLQKVEMMIYQPAIDRVRIVAIEKTERPDTLESVLSWVFFLLGIVGITVGFGVVLRHTRKSKKNQLRCDSLVDGDCTL